MVSKYRRLGSSDSQVETYELGPEPRLTMCGRFRSCRRGAEETIADIQSSGDPGFAGGAGFGSGAAAAALETGAGAARRCVLAAGAGGRGRILRRRIAGYDQGEGSET